MRASDIMSTMVVSVRPETPLRDVARLLLEHGISAVPVLDDRGGVVGMVSEGDLIARDDPEREARRDWWLSLVAEHEAIGAELIETLNHHSRTARDVMSAPVVVVSEATPARDIARLLSTHQIKRVPVVRDSRVVGIVSRADLLRGFAGEEAAPAEAHHGRSDLLGVLGGVFSRLDERFGHGGHHPPDEAASAHGAPAAGAKADDLRALVAEFDQRKAEKSDKVRRAAAERQQDMVKTLMDQHVGDEGWAVILRRAHEAASAGAKEVLVLRFPSDLCSDGGRAVNAPLPDWPKTLRGEAAELYLRWERELKPKGFRMTARVLDFPGGMPGDIGLFLDWSD